MSRRKFYFIGLFFVVIFAIVYALYTKREQILMSVIQKKIDKLEQTTHADLSIGKVRMDGFRKLTIDDLLCLTPAQDTLVTIHKVAFIYDFSNLLRLNANVESMDAEGVRIYYNDRDGKKRYSFLFGNGKLSSSEGRGNTSKIESFMNLYKKISSYFPASMHVSDVLAIGYRKGNLCRFSFPENTLKDGLLESQVIYRLSSPTGQYTEKSFVVTGNLSVSNEDPNAIRIYPTTPQSLPISIKKGDDYVSVGFDTMDIQFSTDKHCENWRGYLRMVPFTLSNERIASVPVRLDSLTFQYSMNMVMEPSLRIELDSSSLLSVNGFSFNPYLLYEGKDTTPCLRVEVHRDSFEAQSLFNSLPKDLFANLEGIQTKGKLSYRLLFDLDMSKIDSLSFSSSMAKSGFSVEKFGKTDFSSVNRPFTYQAFDHGEVDASFVVGEGNPDFARLDEISPYLKNAILYSEDGLFFCHKGFLETAMNAAIVKDIKEKRFVRGGSTISMQLVKNLWLSREKNLSRKLEEALIVWLVENNRLISKNRMYEIYLNIIEWGPHIYGVRQASHFYFSKEPSELTPEESIFMASIIPRPKKFMWFFDNNRDLKPFLAPYFDLLGDKLLRHGIITEEQRGNLGHNVNLTGAARVYLRSSVAKMGAAGVNGDVEDEAVLMESLDKPRIEDETISNRTGKKD